LVLQSEPARGARTMRSAPAKRIIQAYPKLKRPAARSMIGPPTNLIPLYMRRALRKKTRIRTKTAAPAP